MLLIEHTGSIGHFRFDPDTKLYLVFLASLSKPSIPLGSFLVSTTQSPSAQLSVTRGYLVPNHPSSITKSSPPILWISAIIWSIPFGWCRNRHLPKSWARYHAPYLHVPRYICVPIMEVSTCTAQTLCWIGQSECWSLKVSPFLRWYSEFCSLIPAKK